MKKLMILLLVCLSGNAYSEDASYTSNQKVLIVPSVIVDGNSRVYDVILQANDDGLFELKGYLNKSGINGISSKCTKDNINIEKFNQLKKGMTLDDINIIIGCKDSIGGISEGDIRKEGLIYHWLDNDILPSISVIFDQYIAVEIFEMWLP